MSILIFDPFCQLCLRAFDLGLYFHNLILQDFYGVPAALAAVAVVPAAFAAVCQQLLQEKVHY